MKLEIYLKNGETIIIGGLSKEEAVNFGSALVEARDSNVVSIPNWGGAGKIHSVYRVCCRSVEAVQMITKNDEEKKWLFDNLK